MLMSGLRIEGDYRIINKSLDFQSVHRVSKADTDLIYSQTMR
jgi:hypothetical protein